MLFDLNRAYREFNRDIAFDLEKSRISFSGDWLAPIRAGMNEVSKNRRGSIEQGAKQEYAEAMRQFDDPEKAYKHVKKFFVPFTVDKRLFTSNVVLYMIACFIAEEALIKNNRPAYQKWQRVANQNLKEIRQRIEYEKAR